MANENLSFGLKAEHRTELLRQLRRLGPACEFWIFGSRARGDQKPFSDIDILVKGKVEGPRLAELREALEQGPLPYKVDIVLDEELAPAYRSSVESDRIRLDI